MATIIDNGDGSFIAGDPPTELPAGHHWCSECGGSGLVDSQYEDAYYDVCTNCQGGAIIACDCPRHPKPGKKSWTEIYASLELASLADQLTNARDRFAVLRDLNRYDERRDIARARLSALEAGYCALSSVVAAMGPPDRARRLRCPPSGDAGHTWRGPSSHLRPGEVPDDHC